MISSLHWDNRSSGLVWSWKSGDDVIAVDRDIINFESDVFSGLWSY